MQNEKQSCERNRPWRDGLRFGRLSFPIFALRRSRDRNWTTPSTRCGLPACEIECEQELDALVVYGDREHFANLHYLTNYDPRFEEAILVVLPNGVPSLLVGNEGMGYSKIARLGVERVLYQTFSLPGQPRDLVQPLAGVLADRGLRDR